VLFVQQVGKVEEAFRTFRQLHEVDPSTASSAAVVGALAAAALDHDPAAAQTLEQHLEGLPQVSAEEVGSLEAAGPPPPSLSLVPGGNRGVNCPLTHAPHLWICGKKLQFL